MRSEVIFRIICLLFCSLFVSCETDSEQAIPTTGEEIYVAVNYQATNMSIQTKGLTDAEEAAIQDLYIIVFDALSGEKVSSTYFSSSELKAVTPSTGHSQAGTVKVKMRTGRMNIIGVGNVNYGAIESEALFSQLESAITYDDFKNINVSLTVSGNINRRVPALTMCGVLENTNVNDSGWLDETIHLKRLDASIKFIIKNETEQNGVKCRSFHLSSWRVYNIPNQSKIFNNGTDAEGTYNDSAESIAFEKEDNAAGSFNFYLFENRKPAKNNGISSYAEREKYNGFKEGKPDWSYANDSSTYIEIKATIELTIPNEAGGTFERSANVLYRVHLGYTYPEGGNPSDALLNDFLTERNTKYTYTIHIKGVDMIVVEAKRENTEYQHGSEGTVTDAIDGEIISLDAHYAVFNVHLSPYEIRTMSMDFYSPMYGERQYDSADSYDVTNADYQAIRISPTTKDVLVNYSETYDIVAFSQEQAIDKQILIPASDATHTIPLYDLKKFKETFSSSENENEQLWFTVFINENVYYNETDWNKYVNVAPRYWNIITIGERSEDNQSLYKRGKYSFIQRSIQTYRSGNIKAMGLEHINEHRQKKIFEYSQVSRTGTGWNIVSSRLNGTKWTTATQPTKPQKGYPTFMTQSMSVGDANNGLNNRNDGDAFVYDAFYAILNRNRDLNRDGIIQSNEIRWFLPTTIEYSEFVLGSPALETPLFSPLNYDSEKDGGIKIYNNQYYHFWGSDFKNLWSEEEVSVGNISRPNSYAWDIRCARYLGVNDYTKYIYESPFLWNNEKRTITIDNVDSRCIRAYLSGWLILHHCFDKNINLPAQKFKVAKNEINIPTPSNYQTFKINLETNAYCAEYSEEADGSDKGTWRMPNQKELMIMFYTQGLTLNKNGRHFLSCTSWYPSFTANNNYTGEMYYMGLDNNTLRMEHPSDFYAGSRSFKILPVKDVL